MNACARRLKRVFPAAIEYIAMVLPIWPKAYREKVGPEGILAARRSGPGPYRITRMSGADRDRSGALRRLLRRQP